MGEQAAPSGASSSGIASGGESSVVAPENKISSKEKAMEAAKKNKEKRSKSSTLKKLGKRRKHKRNLEPEGFDHWQKNDQDYYHRVSIHLRNWKATRRQSRYIRTPITWWQMLRKAFKGHPMHALEMDAYKKAEASLAGLADKMESLDLEFDS